MLLVLFALESQGLLRLGSGRGVAFLVVGICSFVFTKKIFLNDKIDFFSKKSLMLVILFVSLAVVYGWFFNFCHNELGNDDGYRLSFAQAISAFGLPLKNAWWYANMPGSPSIGYYVFTEYLAAGLYGLVARLTTLPIFYYDYFSIILGVVLVVSVFFTARQLCSRGRAVGKEGYFWFAFFAFLFLASMQGGANTFVSQVRGIPPLLMVTTTLSLSIAVFLTGILGIERRRLSVAICSVGLLVILAAAIATIKMSLLPGVALMNGVFVLALLGLLWKRFDRKIFGFAVVISILATAFSAYIAFFVGPKFFAKHSLVLKPWETFAVYRREFIPELYSLFDGKRSLVELFNLELYLSFYIPIAVALLFVTFAIVTSLRKKDVALLASIVGPALGAAVLFCYSALARSKLQVGNAESYWIVGFLLIFGFAAGIAFVISAYDMMKSVAVLGLCVLLIGVAYNGYSIVKLRSIDIGGKWLVDVHDLCELARKNSDIYQTTHKYKNIGIVHPWTGHRKSWGIAGYCSIPAVAVFDPDDYFNNAGIHGDRFHNKAGEMLALSNTGCCEGMSLAKAKNAIKMYRDEQELKEVFVIRKEASSSAVEGVGFIWVGQVGDYYLYKLRL